MTKNDIEKDIDAHLKEITKKETIITPEKNVNVKTAIENDIDEHDVQIIESNNNSDLLKAMDFLHNPKNMESNTILTNEQVNAISLMNWAGQVYDIQFFKHYVALYPKYRISGDDGRGRKEIIQIAEAIQREKEKERQFQMDMLGRR